MIHRSRCNFRGRKQIGSLRLRFGGMSARAPCSRASPLIQSASYPRSASNMVFGSNAPRRTEHSRLSCAKPAKTRQSEFPRLPLTGHAADMPKSTQMTLKRHCGRLRLA